jgi:glucokinase
LGLSILIDLLNPEAIILGSVYERSGELMYEAMMEAIHQEALVTSRSCCKILPAKLGNSIGDYATMTVALHGGNYEE